MKTHLSCKRVWFPTFDQRLYFRQQAVCGPSFLGFEFDIFLKNYLSQLQLLIFEIKF